MPIIKVRQCYVPSIHAAPRWYSHAVHPLPLRNPGGQHGLPALHLHPLQQIFLGLDCLFSQNRRRQFRPVYESNSGKLLPTRFLKKSFAWHKCGTCLQVAEFVKSPCYHTMHQLLRSLKNLKDTDRHLANCQKVEAFQSTGIRHVTVERGI